MRLLFAESSTRGYGTEQHVAALATAMAHRGHDVQCLVCAGGPVESLLREAAVPIVAVRPGRTRAIRIAAALLRLTRRQRPDWLVSNDPRFYRMFLSLRRLSGARVAIFRHWHDIPAKPRTRELLSHRIDRFVLVSQFHREDYRRQGMDVKRASILYNPIDTGRFQPSRAARARTRERLRFADSDIVVGYVGRVLEAKGIFTLFEAAERFLAETPPARMLWIGDGEGLPALRAKVARSPLASRHVFSDWESDIEAVYPALDILAVPSIYPEPFGRVSVEAQASGVPVVASLAGGLPETLIPGKTGLVAQAGDGPALASAIITLIGDPAQRQRLGAAGREWACARFSLARIAEDFERVLASG